MSSSMSGATGFKSSANRTGDVIPKGYEAGKLQQYTPEQQQLFKSAFGNVGPDSYQARLARGDQEIFNDIEAPQYQQFNQALGNIAGRFSGQGTGGIHSSAFQNESTSAASNFAQDLAARRHTLQQEGIKGLHSMSMELLNQRPEEKFLAEKYQKQNPWADIAGKFAGAIPGAVSSFFNPASAPSNVANIASQWNS